MLCVTRWSPPESESAPKLKPKCKLSNDAESMMAGMRLGESSGSSDSGESHSEEPRTDRKTKKRALAESPTMESTGKLMERTAKVQKTGKFEGNPMKALFDLSRKRRNSSSSDSAACSSSDSAASD